VDQTDMTRAILINLRNFAYWVHALLIFAATSQKDFVAVTPPPLVWGDDIYGLRRQVVFHKRDRRLFTVPLANTIEYYTFRNIFSSEYYGLGQLPRRSEIESFYDAQTRQGKTPLIVDCGSNVGFSLLYFSLCYPRARIIGIEPDPGNFAKALARTREHASVRVINAGIASEEGAASLIDTGKGNDAFQVALSHDGSVRLVSVDGILAQQDDSVVPFLIKIDIEGFEENLFAKNIGWVDRFPMLVIELHDWLFPHEARSQNFLKVIADRKRDFMHFGENFFSIKPQL
jgi:FkbM family methyltransferase